MPSLQDISFDQEKVVIVVESLGPKSEALKNLDNHEVFVAGDSVATPKRTSRDSTPLHLHDHRFFSITLQPLAISFGSGEGVAFRLPQNPSIYSSISRRHFRVFVNQNSSWMLEDISRNGTLVNDEMVHHRQVALHPEEPNPISLGSLEFILHIRTSVDNISATNEKVSETLNVDELELQTQTQTQTQSCDTLAPPKPKIPTSLLHNYHTLSKPLRSNALNVKRLIEKSSGRHVVGKFYDSPIERRLAGQRYIGLFTVLQVSPSVSETSISSDFSGP